MKYYFVRLSTLIGEYEHYDNIVLEAEDIPDFEDKLDDYMQEYHGGWEDKRGETYWYQFDTIAANVETYREIPKEHYDILKQYI